MVWGQTPRPRLEKKTDKKYEDVGRKTRIHPHYYGQEIEAVKPLLYGASGRMPPPASTQ